MICLLCKKIEVEDKNPSIKICSVCRLELELAFSYHIDGKEVTEEEYNRRINDSFR